MDAGDRSVEEETVAQYTEPQYGEPARPARASGHVEQSAWAGWVAFAGIMMVLLGSFHVIEGLVAIFNDEYFLVSRSGLILSFDFTAWGVLHLILGLVIGGAGYAMFAGHMWGRVVGVLVALGSAVVNLGFLAAFPFWSAVMILLDVLVIWAITVHGSELRRV